MVFTAYFFFLYMCEGGQAKCDAAARTISLFPCAINCSFVLLLLLLSASQKYFIGHLSSDFLYYVLC